MNTILSLLSLLFLASNITSSTEIHAKPKPRPSYNSKSFNLNTEVSRLGKLAPNLNKKVLKIALNAYNKATHKGDVKKPILTVIDYSLPSSKQRLWVFDIKKEQLLYNTHVAHGRNSGLTVPNHFSNKSSSKETSLGTYITRDTYSGSKGYSLNLQGLEKGFNDNAYNRRVVMHGAWYVEPTFIKKAGRAGRSWGCPSVAKSLAKPIINTIKNGSVIFAYYPDKSYLQRSKFAMA